jgi:transcriptional antiterminator NusG
MQQDLPDTNTVQGVNGWQPRWYATHTRSRHEKSVAKQLQLRGVEAYLPLYTATHRWNGRRAQVELPLFSGYVFVHIPVVERMRVLEIPGVAEVVSFRGTPAPLDDKEIEGIRQCLSQRLTAEPWEYLRVGDRVRVLAGPLEGLEGTILRQNGRTRFIVSVDLIMRSIAINVEGFDLSVVKTARAAA